MKYLILKEYSDTKNTLLRVKEGRFLSLFIVITKI